MLAISPRLLPSEHKPIGMRITKPSQIRELLNEVHDLWFDVETLKSQPDTHTITLRLELCSKMLRETPSEKSRFLTIRSVEGMTIHDTERIGYYNLDTILWDQERKKILITGGIPISIELIVRTLDLELQGSGLSE